MKMAYTDNGDTLIVILDKKEGKNLCTILQQGMTVAKKNSAGYKLAKIIDDELPVY